MSAERSSICRPSCSGFFTELGNRMVTNPIRVLWELWFTAAWKPFSENQVPVVADACAAMGWTFEEFRETDLAIGTPALTSLAQRWRSRSGHRDCRGARWPDTTNQRKPNDWALSTASRRSDTSSASKMRLVSWRIVLTLYPISRAKTLLVFFFAMPKRIAF